MKTFEQMVEFCRKNGILQYEGVVMVDDASPDDSYVVMQKLRAADPRVRIVQLARNHGQQHATLCGLNYARGEEVVTIDDDLQSPPEEIGDISYPIRALEEYATEIERIVEPEAIRERRFKLVIDYGYGPASHAMSNVMAKLGSDVLGVNPYSSTMGRLVFDIASEPTGDRAEFHLALSPFRQVVKDYFQICEAYFDAVKRMPPSQIEAIDMARRGIHNEGARVLQERLEGKADLDIDTARRLFTLICVLHFGG